MINIKCFATPKKSGGSGGGSSMTNITNNTVVNAESDNWFFFDTDNNAVGCKYDFYSVGAVSANGIDPDAGNNSGVVIDDNLTSPYTDHALSANQGRVLKSLIDNIGSGQGGGQVLNSCDWSNVTNKPSTYPPSAHTHNIGDINTLGSTLNNIVEEQGTISMKLDQHTLDSSVHVTAAQQNLLSNLSQIDLAKLNALLSLITVNTDAGTITVSGNIFATNNVTAQV